MPKNLHPALRGIDRSLLLMKGIYLLKKKIPVEFYSVKK